jgi:hypothetical protein
MARARRIPLNPKQTKKTDRNELLLEHGITHAASKHIPDELYGFQRNKQ